MLSIIVAMSQNGVIGIENRLPWHLSADLKRFKSITMGKPIIMGRKTYQSIGKPLPGRRNIVVSRNLAFLAPGCEVVASLDQALHTTSDAAEVMVIGGAELIAQALPKAARLYLTVIHHDFKGDCFFPDWDRTQWREINRIDQLTDENNPYAYSLLTFERILKD